MAYLFNGATHIINRADAVLQSWPITFHGRIRLPNSGDGLTHLIVGLSESATHNGFRILAELNTGTMKVRCGTRAGGTAASATSTTSIGDSNWHSVVGEITAANARQVWLDNAGNGSNATSLTPSTLTKTAIGAQDSGGTLSGNVGHELADIAVWAGTLTAEERAALAAGVSPALIRPDILKIYDPLIGNGTDWRGAPFTITGATVAVHPAVFMPARAQVFKTAIVIGPTGLATETDIGLALAGVQIGTAGLASETDIALALSSARPAGLASETDTALALSAGSSNAVGLATEADTAFALAGVAITPIGLAPETDNALALSGIAIRAAGLASSVESALPLGSARPAGAANDNETAFSLAAVSVSPCGTAAETDTALACAPVQIKLVGVSTETDTAFGLSAGGTSVGIVVETDIALALQGSSGSTPPDRRFVSVRDRSIVGNARGSRAIVSAARKRAA